MQITLNNLLVKSINVMITFKQFLLEAPVDRPALLAKYLESKANELDKTVLAKSIHKKSNGTVRHVRLKSEDVEALFKKIGATLTFLPGEKKATGKSSYKTYNGVLNKDHGEFKKGEQFCVVNTFVSGSKILNKQLSPSKLGLETDEGKYHTVDKVVSLSIAAIKKLEMFSEEEITYFTKLLALNKSETHALAAPSDMSAEDLNRIAIDFGEVFGATWYARKLKMPKIAFPKGNNALVDFELFDGDMKKPVSSKAGKGAPPSLGVVVDQVNLDKKYFEKKYGKDVVATLNLIHESTAIEGALAASKALKTPGFTVLKDLMGTDDMSRKSIESYLSNFKTKEQLVKALNPWFEAIERKPTDAILSVIFNEGGQRVGIVSAQMANYLVTLFNKDAKYKKFNLLLNDAVTRIKVDQLYTNMDSKKIDFKLKPFETGEFLWINNSSTMKANLSKIGFKMR